MTAAMAAATDLSNTGYYIVRALGRTDDRAIEWLNRLGVETFYPMTVELRKVPRREMSRSQRMSGIEIKRPTIGPLFPRYIFARFDQAKHSWRDVMNMSGVGGMVCEGDMPVRVDPRCIERIRARENNGTVPGTDSLRAIFAIGEHVTVTDGPFASFSGTVERGLDVPVEKLDPQERIRIALEIFGRPTPVDLAVWQVAKC